MPESWRIEGEYLENCNCEVLCPCLLGPRNAKGGAAARPTEGHCDVPLVFQIARGSYGAVDLGGTAAALAVYTPGPMGDGNWTVGAYVDGRARDDQRRSEEHTSELQSQSNLVCRLLLEKKKTNIRTNDTQSLASEPA